MLVYGTRLWFVPEVGFKEPTTVAARWLSRKIGKQLVPEPLLDGVERAFDGGHHLRSVVSTDAFPRLLAIGYTHPDSDVAGRQWVTEIGLRQLAQGADIECTVLLSTNEISARVSTAVQESRPGIVNELVRRCKLSPTTRGITTHVLDDESADAFRHVVLDPERGHALVVLSPLPDGSYPADPKALSSLLLGLADIATIPPTADTYWLARVVGREYVPYRGAAMLIYPAGRRLDAGAPATRLYTVADAAALSAKGVKLENELFSVVLHRSNVPLARSHISCQLVKETQLRRDLVHRREEAVKSGNLQDYVRYLEEEVAKVEQEKKDLASLVDSLDKLTSAQEERERKLSFDNEGLKQRLAEAGRGGRSGEEELEDTIETAEAVLASIGGKPTPERSLRIVEHLFQKRVVILPEAWRSARDASQFKYGAKLYQLLHLLLTEYWEALCSGRPDSDARKALGSSYAAKESEGVEKNTAARARRTFSYNGRPTEMMKHLKIGVKDSAAETIRVHFEWFPEERRIVIGHCGAHIPFK